MTFRMEMANCDLCPSPEELANREFPDLVGEGELTISQFLAQGARRRERATRMRELAEVNKKRCLCHGDSALGGAICVDHALELMGVSDVGV